MLTPAEMESAIALETVFVVSFGKEQIVDSLGVKIVLGNICFPLIRKAYINVV